MSADNTVETAQRATGELVRQSLQKGNPVRVSLTTASMSPNLLPGDELIVAAAEWQKLKTGDIVLYERSEVLFAHRLIRVERQYDGVRLITKGDAAGSYDSPVSIASYLGKVARVVRGGRHINLEGRGARAGARLRVVRSVSRSMITRLTHNIQARLGIVSILILVPILFGVATATAAVTISSFTASGGQGQIKLTWTTATEVKNFGFNLFRSSDQTTWSKVAFVQSQSPCFSSVTGNSYSYTDNSIDLVLTGTYYYRLQLNGLPCNDADEYYDRIVSASPNGGKNPSQPTVTPTSSATPVPPTATPTTQPTASPTTQPTATATSVPPTATPTNVPQATSTDTPQAQNTQAPTNTPLPTKTPVSSTALRSTPTATLTGVTRLPTMAGPVATQPPAGTEQPTPAVATDAPTADAPTASPAATEVAIVVASDTPPSAGPQGSSRPVQLQPTPAPAVAGSLLVGLGLVGVLGMGAAGFLLLGLAGIVIWRLYARG